MDGNIANMNKGFKNPIQQLKSKDISRVDLIIRWVVEED